MAPAEKTKAKEEAEPPSSGEGIIDMSVFQQIRDMDDDDEDEGEGGEISREFSRGIVWGYFEQAEQTFKDMEAAIAEPSPAKLSALGHFLKGSSAALGIIKVQDSCEKMQHYGNLRDEEAGVDLKDGEALKRIEGLLADCKRDYEVAKIWMKKLYEDEEGGKDDEDGDEEAEDEEEEEKVRGKERK